MQEVDRTVNHMKDEAANFPDPADRATQEEEFSLELRTRDRERKLIKKIDSTMERIEQDDYGYCEACGVEIGIQRLEARPTATPLHRLQDPGRNQGKAGTGLNPGGVDRHRSVPLSGAFRALPDRPTAPGLTDGRPRQLSRRPPYGGSWLVRMEDLDPPREEARRRPRASCDSLRCHGLHWDEEVLFQSPRGAAYTAPWRDSRGQATCFPVTVPAQCWAPDGACRGHCRERKGRSRGPHACASL